MSNETESRGYDPAFEEDLSAYLDGELSPERRAEVTRELERSPALAARLEALRRVDADLGEIPVSPVPADLRARLQARIDAAPIAAQDASAPGDVRRKAPGRRRGWRARPAMVAAAMAAAVALFLLVRRPVELPPERIAESPAPEVQPSPSPDLPIVAPESPAPEPMIAERPAPPAPEAMIAEVPEPESMAPAPEPVGIEPRAPEATPPSRVAETTPEAELPPAQLLASAADEELEVAMEWEVLEDLELIEELDLLEAMVALSERGRS